MRVAYVADKQSKKQVGSDMFIVPTDDERLKVVLIPYDVLTPLVVNENLDMLTMIQQVQKVIKNSEVST
jgi:hypothetical protein